MELGSGIRDPEKTYSGPRIPYPGQKAPDPGSATLDFSRINDTHKASLKQHFLPQNHGTVQEIYGQEPCFLSHSISHIVIYKYRKR
jgi:hypothetical protein